MRLIVDSNIIIAAMRPEAFTRKLIVHPDLELLSPEFLLVELEEHEGEIMGKTGLAPDIYRNVQNILLSNVTIIPFIEYRSEFESAMDLMKVIDVEDSAFIAAACALRTDGIWSNDSDMRKQSRVKVWTTRDLIGHLGLK